LDVIRTKVLRGFLLAIHSHWLLSPPPLLSKSGLKLVCNVNIVFENLKSENSQERLCPETSTKLYVFMNSASVVSSERSLVQKVQNIFLKPEKYSKCCFLYCRSLLCTQILPGPGDLSEGGQNSTKIKQKNCRRQLERKLFAKH